MARLLACPFCRELFAEDEARECPQCELPLLPMERLPLSAEALAEQDAATYVPPEHRRLSPWFWRRGRGVALACAGAGVLLFFAPWFSVQRPDVELLSGFSLATRGAPWLWGGAIAWFIQLALVLSRRSVGELRGVRVICVTFALMNVGECALLLLRPPAENAYYSAGVSHAWALWATLGVACVSVVNALRLGGRVDDRRHLPVDEGQSGSTSAGQLLH